MILIDGDTLILRKLINNIKTLKREETKNIYYYHVRQLLNQVHKYLLLEKKN